MTYGTVENSTGKLVFYSTIEIIVTLNLIFN